MMKNDTSRLFDITEVRADYRNGDEPSGRLMSDEPIPTEGEILLYTTPNSDVRVEVYYQGETFWLTLNRMAELFGSSKQAISYHLQNIFASNELRRESTVKEILTVQAEGGRNVSLPYVACTRARDHLLVTSVDPASEFLDDLRK